jgi:hypothetical protein
MKERYHLEDQTLDGNIASLSSSFSWLRPFACSGPLKKLLAPLVTAPASLPVGFIVHCTENWLKSKHSHPIYLITILILSYHLHLCLQSAFILSYFLSKVDIFLIRRVLKYPTHRHSEAGCPWFHFCSLHFHECILLLSAKRDKLKRSGRCIF